MTNLQTDNTPNMQTDYLQITELTDRQINTLTKTTDRQINTDTIDKDN